MSIKLVALDLDDTLLDSKKRISSQCATAIREARSKGVMVTLATGRMFRSAVTFAKELEIDLPLITYQGALVKNMLSEQTLYYRPLPNELSKAVMLYLKENRIYYHGYMDDQLYVESINEENQNYARITGVDMVLTESLLDLLENQPVMEILAYARQEQRLLQIADELHQAYGDRLNISRFKNNYLEIMDKEATKLHALQFVCDQYGIGRHEVMAVGDNYNDISMIRWAGLGVAMDNAYPDVKDAADYITRSNDQEGVAEAIRKFVL